MIKLFVWIGVIGTTAIAYLATYGVGPEAQLPPEISQLAMFEEEGLVPNANDLEENPELEHGVFEVPDEDEAELAIAMEEFAQMDMGGMDMGGMDMSTDAEMSDTEMGEMNMGTSETTMNMDSNSTMDMSGEGSTDMNMTDTATATMDMDGDGVMDMNGSDMATAAMDMAGSGDTAMNMDMDGDGVMDMSSSDMATGTMDMSGSDSSTMNMDMAGTGDTMEEGMGESAGGLLISDSASFDREFTLTMQEWGYSDMQIDVKMGERIKFTVKNGGQIPHEFMFMNMPLMGAVDYRLTRADWSLLEHEALFEEALVLPGGEFTFTVQITQPGSWMFMCMLPYHMQMGMMGQMATDGMAMDMQM